MRSVYLFLRSSKFVYLCLLCIIIIGSFLRLEGVFTNSFAFTYDVGRDMFALRNIVVMHKIPLIGFTTGLSGVFYGPWWYIILLLPFILVRGNPQGIACFIALTGIISIPLGYYLGRKIANAFLGLIIALFISISPAMIGITSQIWNPNLAPLFVILVFWILIILFQDKENNRQSENNIVQKKDFSKTVYFLLLGILLGLTIDMEIVFGSLFFVSICVIIGILLRKQIRLASFISFVFGIVLIFSPRIFFEFRHQFLMTKTILSVLRTTAAHPSLQILPILLQRSIFFFSIWTDTLAGHNGILGIVLIFFVGMTVVVLCKEKNNSIRDVVLTTIIILIVYIFGLTFFSHDIWPHYTVGIPVIYIFLFSICLWYWYNHGKITISILIALLLFWVNAQPLQLITTFQKPLWEGDASVYRNQLAVVDYIYQQASGKKFKYIVYTPPVIDYTYQYLFMWYGKNIYHYIPETNKAHLFFVILEPDREKPFREIDWLKSRAKDGRIITEKKLTGGIIVQTRRVD